MLQVAIGFTRPLLAAPDRLLQDRLGYLPGVGVCARPDLVQPLAQAFALLPGGEHSAARRAEHCLQQFVDRRLGRAGAVGAAAKFLDDLAPARAEALGRRWLV